MKPTTRHIFFDLDHTLWDFERNAFETLKELFAEFAAHIGNGLTFERFFAVYRHHNERLWAAYREDRIDSHTLRTTRWHRTFDELGVAAGTWRDDFGYSYMSRCPTKPHLIPFAREVLDQLRQAYSLHIITNGFRKTQEVKLQSADLTHYFNTMVTPDEAGVKKPDPGIFSYALQMTGVAADESIYVGDNYDADVVGALNSGLPVVFFNPEKRENPDRVAEIGCLRELRGMLEG